MTFVCGFAQSTGAEPRHIRQTVTQDKDTTTANKQLQSAKCSDLNESTAKHLDLLKRCLIADLYPESAYLTLRPRGVGLRQWVRNRILGALAKRGYLIQKMQPFDVDRRKIGADWPSIGYSMIGRLRMDNIQWCVEQIHRDGVPGDLLEAGVWKGGAIIMMLATLEALGDERRKVWLADSFEGLPKPTREEDCSYDLSNESYLAVSVEEVRENLDRFGLLDDDRVRLLKGWFKDTLPTAPVKEIALLRLDGDLYESTMDVLKSCYHKMQVGGFVIIDDYGYWPPCQQAVDEFREAHGIKEPLSRIDDSGVYWRVSPERDW